MSAVVQLLWNLSLMRAGPEQVPVAPLFVALLLVANLAVSTTGAWLFSTPQATVLEAIARPTLALAVLASITWVALLLAQHPERFTRTFTALLGADLVITALSLPVLLLVAPPVTAPTDQAPVLALIVQLAMIVWWLTVAGFIFRRAMAFSQPQGVALALFSMVMSLILIAITLPPPTTA